jgi:Sec-independent protein secretion pathway component TatC
MLLIMAPLVLLYEGSIIVARRFGRPPEPAFHAEPSTGEAG